MNPESYRFVASLRSEYPRIEVTIIDPNKKDMMTHKFGKDISKLLKKLHQERGVQFVQKRKLLSFEGEGRKISKIKLRGKEVDTDYVVLFPNKFVIDSELLRSNPKFEQSIILENNGQVRADYKNNAGTKRVFVAGAASATFNLSNRERTNDRLIHRHVNEGVNAAYNILGLVRKITKKQKFHLFFLNFFVIFNKFSLLFFFSFTDLWSRIFPIRSSPSNSSTFTTTPSN